MLCEDDIERHMSHVTLMGLLVSAVYGDDFVVISSPYTVHFVGPLTPCKRVFIVETTTNSVNRHCNE